ncbi:Tad domain-containing protein [Palleronia pelagia]|uniref:Flp pilus assembly protein TadG n=1 Tax=Palleronia pelagia TaxID=387096 RepID=A0A1H8LS57_9RHOB|nr:Tad domain-containing protein [Palleronia pelagia]SEO07934.1 Flp pilus assembly protein TadG [Palleronia pelagia]
MTFTRDERPAPGASGRFAREEDGSFVLFGIYLVIAMLLVGGVAVDIIRHDYERIRMQGVVDTAILAAADLDQTLDPEAVVRDHFDKAGVLERLDHVEVIENINSRVVSAQASMDVNTMFIRSIGMDKIGALAGGMAREDIRDIEVSLVLDISGSMADFSRIDNLKTAAKDFVSTVLSGVDDGRENEVSISIVPYSTEVNIGSEMASLFALTDVHDFSHCVNFQSSDFDSIAMDLSLSRQQTAHFDPFTNGFTFEERAPDPLLTPCRADEAAEITYFSQDEAELHASIDALTPGGNTSIDVGLKWGAALLDPSMRTPITTLSALGKADPAFVGRPYDHDRNNTMKIIVVMTDGQNTYQYRLKDAYRGTALTDVWGAMITGASNPEDDGFRLSIDDDEYQDFDNDGRWEEDWWIPNRGRWYNSNWGGDTAHRMTYQELWSVASLGWHAYWGRYRQYNNADTYYSWKEIPYTNIGPATKDPRMTDMCEQSKDAGILVFSIALDVAESNATRMEDCASSDNHYFNVQGTELLYAFSAIASTINQLRLVQ